MPLCRAALRCAVQARSVKKRAAMAQRALGIKGKMFAKERAKEKVGDRKQTRERSALADKKCTGWAARGQPVVWGCNL